MAGWHKQRIKHLFYDCVMKMIIFCGSKEEEALSSSIEFQVIKLHKEWHLFRRSWHKLHKTIIQLQPYTNRFMTYIFREKQFFFFSEKSGKMQKKIKFQMHVLCYLELSRGFGLLEKVKFLALFISFCFFCYVFLFVIQLFSVVD